ncbi:MAG TPA: FAD:protein FMN transferase [Patescibacteria group bacterium]|nr:FAD:protein FMN transferase [Patescibacteria group bacterium]
MPASNAVVYERVKRSAQSTLTGDFYKLSFQAMNTICRVHFRTNDPKLARDLQNNVLQWVAWFEARYSRFIPDSLIGQINSGAGRHWVDVDPETDALFNLCHEMIFFTRGVFDPTALPLIRLWDWKANPPVVPDSIAIQAAQELVGWHKIQRRPGSIFLPREGMSLDLGGIGKEYAVDRVVTMISQSGVKGVLVDFGADIRVQGEPPERGAWHIGLEDPKNPGHVWTGVAVTNQAVATSGDYLRHFVHQGRRYGHILDPRSGYPVSNGILSVSVIAPHCTVAGILSTSVFVLGPQQGMDLINLCPGAEGCITTETNRFQTKGFYAYTTS